MPLIGRPEPKFEEKRPWLVMLANGYMAEVNSVGWPWRTAEALIFYGLNEEVSMTFNWDHVAFYGEVEDADDGPDETEGYDDDLEGITFGGELFDASPGQYL